MKLFSSSGRPRAAILVALAALLAGLAITFPGGSDLLKKATAWSIEAGFSAALVACVAIVVNVGFRHWLSARQMGLLWGLVLVRLLVPIGPPSALSLQNAGKACPRMFNAGPDTQTGAPSLRRTDSTVSSSNDPQCQPPFTIPACASALEEIASASSPWKIAAAGRTFDIFAGDGFGPFVAMLAWAWAFGTLVSLLSTGVVHWRFCRRLRHVLPSEDRRLCELWKHSSQTADVRRSIAILVFDGVDQPAVLGLIRPKLLLPTAMLELTDEQLRMVMLHELAHIRRWHIAANWVLVLVRAIHWWNPVCWLAVGRFESLREQQCDAFAIQRIEGQPVRSYGELLLSLAARPQAFPRWRVSLPASLLGFLSSAVRLPSVVGSRSVGNRLRALHAAGVRRGRWHTATVATLVCLIGLCGLTDASLPDAAPAASSQPTASNTKVESPASTGDLVDYGSLARDWKTELSVSGTYDVAKAIERIAAVEPQENPPMSFYWAAVWALRATTLRSELNDDRKWEKEHLKLDGVRLTVQAPLRIHEEFAKNLRAWEQSGLTQISVRPRLIFETLGPAAAFSSGHHSETVVLNAKQALALLKAADKDTRVSLVSQSIAATTFNGQRASFLSSAQGDFGPPFQEDRAGAGPSEKPIPVDGFRLTWQAVESRDLKSIRLEGSVETGVPPTTLLGERSMPSRESDVRPGPLPGRPRTSFVSEVQDGQSLLIGGLRTRDEKQCVYVLLTVRHIAPPLPSGSSPPATKK